MRARIALGCSIVLFVFVAAFIALPDMWLARIWLALRGASKGARRKAASVRTVRWGGRLSRWISAIMRIHTRFEIHGEDDGHPVIVLSNHTGTYDVIAILGLVSRIGRDDIRWVMKREMMHAPVIGAMARMVGCIPLSRNRDPRDYEAIELGARHAGEEWASPLIFPEGTRFDPAKTRDGFRYVLSPRKGGFDALRAALPDYPVLDVTFEWRPRLSGREGKTMWSALDLYGRELHVTARFVRPEELKDPHWLIRAFRRKDRLLAEQGS